MYTHGGQQSSTGGAQSAGGYAANQQYGGAQSTGGYAMNQQYGGGAYQGYGPGTAPPPDDAGCVVGGGGCPSPLADGCVATGCATTTTAAMTYVGTGRGDHTVTTTYKFVGPGAGDLTMLQRMQVSWGRLLTALCLLLALGGVIALLTLPQDTSTTTPVQQMAMAAAPLPKEAPQIGECTFWGDPHFLTFDGARPSFYGEGELYIVKSDKVAIQGRYKGTRFTKGLAATNKVAVGGKFLNNHVIEVGCMESGDILIDGEPALTNFPQNFSFPDVEDAKIIYSAHGELVDQATAAFDKRRIVHMDLPMGVHLDILRWANYVDFRLRMPRQDGQDGGCGNFNGDASDDTTEAIFSRDGARVQDDDFLFSRRTDVRVGETQKKLLDICPEEQMAKARKECAQELSGIRGAAQDEIQLQSCYLDICFGANEHTLRMATSLGM